MPILLHPIHKSDSPLPVFLLNFYGEISSDEFDEWLTKMREILAKSQPFAVIYQSQTGLSLPDDYRSKEAVWYKTHKAQFFEHCKALVRIANSQEEQAHLDSPNYHKAWQVPYCVVLTEDEARHWLSTHTGAML